MICLPDAFEPSRRLPLLLALAALSCAAFGQSPIQFRTMQKRVFPEHLDLVVSMRVVTPDIDGDGDLDVYAAGGVFWGQGGQDRLFRNDGRGHFVDITFPNLGFDASHTEAVCFVDVDGDGDLDLIQGNGYEMTTVNPQDRLLLNDGSGQFLDATSSRLPPDSDNSVSLAAGDVDGDGDADLVQETSSGVRLCLNDGTGHFSDATAGRVPSVLGGWGVCLADLDGDGDLDLVQSTYYQFGLGGPAVRVLTNTGLGVFVDTSSASIVPPIDQSNDVAVFDGDGDGDLDLVNVTAGMAGNRFYRNNGQGLLVDATGPALAAMHHERVDAGDWNGDGNVDLALVQVVGELPAPDLLWNDGFANFQLAPISQLPTPMPDERIRDLEIADMDGDGDADLCLLGHPGNRAGPSEQMWERIQFNIGGGVFRRADEREIRSSAPFPDGAAGDVDGDGDADLLLTGSNVTRMFRNDGKGRYTDVTPSLLPTVATGKAPVFGDFDGDGRLDLFLGRNESLPSFRAQLWRGTAAGAMVEVSATQLPAYTAVTQAVAAGDVDGDGDLDLVLGNSGSNNMLLCNAGSGVFVDVPNFAGVAHSTGVWNDGVQLVDFDGDGDLDYCNFGSYDVKVFENVGSCAFVLRATIAGLSPSSIRAGRAADFDGDGLAEIFVGFHGDTGKHLRQSSLWSFTATQLPFGTGQRTWDTATLDFDEDGDLDLAIAMDHGCQLFESTPTGLGDVTGRWFAHGAATGLVIADLDGDLDSDIGMLGLDVVRLYMNQHRQHTAVDTPRLGARYRVELSCRPGYLVAPVLAVTAFSVAEASQPWPGVGTIGVDLSAGHLLGSAMVAAPVGVLDVDLALPNQPGLLGLPLWGQTLFVDLTAPIAPLRLTNTQVDIVW